MKAQLILLALAASLASFIVAEPSCPTAGDTETVVYFPHPTDCSKFLTCHWGHLVELSCPAGTFWNDAVKVCDLQGNVVCTQQPEPTTTEPVTTTTVEPTTTTTELTTTTSTTVAPSTNPAPNGHCPENYDPNHQVYLPHEDCTKYYVCTWGGVAVQHSCPPNLHWNQQNSYCDYPTQAGCSPTSPTPQTTSAPVTTSTSTSPTTPPPASTGDCPAVYDPNHQVYFPHPDCSKYYICTYEGNKLEQNCPPNLHWNQQLSYCDYPAHAGCSSTSSAPSQPTSVPDTTTTPPSSTTPPPSPTGDCPPVYDPNHQVYFPHPDCSKYYICTYEGNKLEQNCPAGLHWSQAQSYCDRPELAHCTPSKQADECPEVYDPEHPVFFPHEADCGQYYVCYDGHKVEHQCPEDLHWNQDESKCDAQDLAGCVDVTEELVTDFPVPECPSVVEEEEDQPIFFPYPEDCTKYYVCSNEFPFEMNCPGGTFWNAEENVCDAPASSGCVPKME